ncbi:uncharacterized protein LOC142976245 isoform X2 [Anticarsia gemmatalis]|uniref:uncharacterized protein LOC142976245 isoform X2 n=1 Tax=Anticarsia gemmatalis TaxID=129554 RepID=UPI003F76663A
MSDEGGEDLPPRSKRKIKNVMVASSDSGSDSDESLIAAGTRRKRLMVVSDEGSDVGNDSSGSSVVCSVMRRRRALPKLRDSDSDTSGWATDHSDAPKPSTSGAKPSTSGAKPSTSGAKPSTSSAKPSSPGAKLSTSAAGPTSGFASDSSEGNSDKCSICLMRFTDQQVGTPQSCEHIFCLDCITEWSKNVNTCPVDRMTFDFIVVRACAGGRVLCTQPVKVAGERAIGEMVPFDHTFCEVCFGEDNEEYMLLCDACDLGYHLACLDPPLLQVPDSQWFCPDCEVMLRSDMGSIFAELTEPTRARAGRARTAISGRLATSPVRYVYNTSNSDQNLILDLPNLPSTSASVESPSTSRDTSSRNVTTRRRPTTQHRRHKRRTKTLIVEYVVEGNDIMPVTKTVTRKIKNRKYRRQPRTAARRTLVRASVRERLAASGLAPAPPRAARAARSHAGDSALATLRHRAGVPALSLFGSPHELEYFSEEEARGPQRAGTAVAARPAPASLGAYRQARRKMVTVPSPPPASSAPDVLSSILESQTRLHSRNSVVSISVDGSVNIKVETRESGDLPAGRPRDADEKRERVDLSRAEDATRKTPSYPGQSRGGGGWGGGYRGNYHRDQNANNFNNGRGGNYENNYGGGGGYQNRQGNANSYHQNNNMRRDDGDAYNNFPRRPHHYSIGEETNFDRNRRQPPAEQNRGVNAGPNPRLGDQPPGRYSLAPSWQPYVPPPVSRAEPPPHRHSFGGFDNDPLDMRVAPVSRQASAGDKPQPYRPLPEPPVFKFDKTADVDKSEDEKSDSGLVIDTEKYDPTDPTNDDDSADDDAAPPAPTPPAPATAPATAPAPPAPPQPSGPATPLPAAQHAVQNILAGLDTSGMNVPPNVLDSAVRAVLKEHHNLIVPAPAPLHDRSDDDSEGDCPNFSIYSATSVHFADTAGELAGSGPAPPAAPAPHDNLEDLVQEDDEMPDETAPAPPPPPPPTSHVHRIDPISRIDPVKKKSDEELKEKVSKRCPITTNPRNPIKIKLNTPSLIKRQMSLYDEEEEDAAEDMEAEPVADDAGSPKRSPRATAPEPGDKEKSPGAEERTDLVRDQLEDTDATAVVDKPSTPPHDYEAPATPTTPTPMDVEPLQARSEAEHKEERSPRSEEPAPEPRAASTAGDKSADDSQSDDEERVSGADDDDLPLDGHDGRSAAGDAADELIEKMTESISETEDERSYTPCLDENKSKDTSLETDKDKGIEGLDTEMISEDEGNEMFSDTERAASPRASPRDSRRASPHSSPRASPPRAPPHAEEGEILDKKKDAPDTKKRKKKESKKEGKDKNKSKSKKTEIAFKKLSKSGKERNYRDRDKDKEKEKNKRERRDSSDGNERERNKRRKERRKDLERYDVRTVVSEKRRRPKDAFGRDVSPRHAPRSEPSASRSPPPRRSASPPPRARRSASPRARRSASPRARRSASPRARRSASPRARRSTSPRATPPRRRASSSPRRRVSASPRRRASASPRSTPPRLASPVRAPRRRRRSADREKRPEPRRRREPERSRKRRRSASAERSPRAKPTKRKKRARSSRSGSRRRSPRRRSPRRRRVRRRSASRTPEQSPAPDAGPEPAQARSPGSVDSRLLSPRTPPPEPSPSPPPELRRARRRRDPERARHRRVRDAAGPSKEVFTSGDNILVSVSFKEQERAEGEDRRERRRERRRRRRRAAAPDADAVAAKPVAIIDLERSPFRELTPSPRNVIVLLSDDDAGEKEAAGPGPAGPAPGAEPAHGAVGPKTPPEPGAAPGEAAASGADEARGPLTPPEPPDSPDAYDPYEPTRSASASPPSPHAASPPRALMTLEAAQKTNLSADDVIDRRPISPIEKVMALLQSTRDVSPDKPPPGEAETEPAAPAAPVATVAATPAPATAPVAPQPAAAPPIRIVLPSPTRAAAPKLFLAKPSPIKSDPIKPMPATKLTRSVPATRRPDSDAEADSPYSPGSSDFGDLFEPPGACRDPFDAIAERPARARKQKSGSGKMSGKLGRKKGKTQVGVKLDDDNLKILDELPSSAVEMQVKSKFLKKLNRQERVVEEVKLVLKPHYNKKHVTKDEYKDILRRAVPKICHNKSGEINPAKIQALVEAYVKKFRKKHKLGLV